MAELDQLGEADQDLRPRGVRACGVSSDDQPTAEALHARLGLPFPLLADEELTLIDALGLRHEKGHGGRDIARPALVLAAATGRIVWTFQGSTHQERASVETILAAADEHLEPRPAFDSDSEG